MNEKERKWKEKYQSKKRINWKTGGQKETNSSIKNRQTGNLFLNNIKNKS